MSNNAKAKAGSPVPDGNLQPSDAYQSWEGVEEAVARVDREKLGEKAMAMMGRLFPITRSITGNGVRETLAILGETADLQVHEVPTGYEAFDWVVPREWNIKDAYVMSENGQRVVDMKDSNLHVLNYSLPVSVTMPLHELKKHLYTLPDQPEAIPYVTSYYAERWGFCLSQRQLDSLPEGMYSVHIDSALENGHLTYADAVIPGRTRDELFFTTYICHPSMANNELSGPVLTALLHQLLSSLNLRYTYRFVFAPETIGALVYLSKHGEHLQQSMEAGYVVTCVGDPGPYTYRRSRRGNTNADKAAEHCLKYAPDGHTVKTIDYFPPGSDERQYCSPGFDLPVGSLMRSMYGTYREYHTSLDNLDLVSAEGIADSLRMYLRMVQAHELNLVYKNLSPYGEPQLGKRGLYATIGGQGETDRSLERLLCILNYADGAHDLLDIANIAGQPIWTFGREVQKLIDTGLLEQDG